MAAEEESSELTSILSLHLGGKSPRKVNRSDSEVASSIATIKKEDRSKLKVAELCKLQLSAEEGAKTLFTWENPISTDGSLSTGQIKTLAGRQTLVKGLEKSIHSFDMFDVFHIPLTMIFGNYCGKMMWLPGGIKSVNLFESPKEVTVETVVHASSFVSQLGEDSAVQNLHWSGTRILNSCDELLKTKILEALSGFKEEFGTIALSCPVCLKILSDVILIATDQSLCGLVKQFEALKPADFPGENIMEYVTHIRAAYEMLRQHNALPFDAVFIVLAALEQVSTRRFSMVFSTARANHSLNSGTTLSVPKLLDLAQQEYASLATSGEWEKGGGDSGENQDSVFFNGGRGGRGPGGGRGPIGGRGPAGGRGPGGRGRGRGRGGGRGTGYGADGKDRRPPAQGEPRERDVNGRPEKWCGVCGYWTWGAEYSHFSDGCPYRQQQAANVPGQQQSANVAGQVTPRSVAAEGNQRSEVSNSTRGNDNSAGQQEGQQEGQRVNFAGVPALHFT